MVLDLLLINRQPHQKRFKLNDGHILRIEDLLCERLRNQLSRAEDPTQVKAASDVQRLEEKVQAFVGRCEELHGNQQQQHLRQKVQGQAVDSVCGLCHLPDQLFAVTLIQARLLQLQ
jgi:hypothetical protein